jgi:hypothetical protein
MYIEMYTTWKILLLGSPCESSFHSSALKVKTRGNCNKITAFLYYPSVQSPSWLPKFKKKTPNFSTVAHLNIGSLFRILDLSVPNRRDSLIFQIDIYKILNPKLNC